ncbi:MAG TPA: protein phosphatase 2C domain-containing protein [Patescibacteria group bacterium]|nr:protein phosphatase 2C domain-containing protein [Patescibacteria group bacterium]
MPKAGNAAAEYEDAFWPPKRLRTRKAQLRLAVADGATETSYSGLWAKQLVEAFGYGRVRPETLCKDLAPLQERWREEVHGKALPWYTEENLRSGTFASFLGLTFSARSPNDHHGAWQALAVGDCCVAQVRGNVVLASFPLGAAADFNNRPCLLSSDPATNGAIENHLRTLEGTWATDDTFFLMTDALAHWFYQETEQGERPWNTLRDLDTTDEPKPFPEWIADLRGKGAIKNDDVTLFRADLH